VQLKSRSGVIDWTDMPIQSWSDNLIVFEVFCGTLNPGNYRVRVRNQNGISNQLGFTFTKDSLACGPLDSAPCTATITLNNLANSYGASQDSISAPGATDGQYRVVDLISSQGTFSALKIAKWESNKIKIKLTDIFRDLDTRNYVQDEGEPTLDACNLDPGNFRIFIRTITYSDDDQTGTFSAGDTILQVSNDAPFFTFELTEDPYIAKTKPKQCANQSRLVLKGIHFGDTQGGGVVRIGKKSDAEDPALGKGKLLDRVKKWQNEKVVVRLKVKSQWEGKKRFVWIEKDGIKSNYKKLEILANL
jgi:hypothetical protein